jgi:hypothetical protein
VSDSHCLFSCGEWFLFLFSSTPKKEQSCPATTDMGLMYDLFSYLIWSTLNIENWFRNRLLTKAGGPLIYSEASL